MKAKVKSLNKPIIKIALSAVLITVLFATIDRQKLVESISGINFAFVPLVVALIVLNYVISSIRWKNLLSIYPNSHKAGTPYLINLYFIGSFFNNFMPTSIGGDVYKIVKLGARIDSKAHAFSATFMERFTGVISLVFISVFGFAITLVKGFEGFENDFILLGIVSVSLVGGFSLGSYVGLRILMILRKKIKKLEKVYDSLIKYKGQNRVLVIAFSSSFAVQLCAIFSQYFILSALGVTVDVFRALFIFPLITLASFFIPSLNGIGVQDFLYKFSNGFLMIAEPTAIAGSIVYHLFRLFVSMFGGILYALGKSD